MKNKLRGFDSTLKRLSLEGMSFALGKSGEHLQQQYET
jgi:hypothetical protein